MGSLAGACLLSPLMIYQDPLAYLLGLEGIALLDAWAGDHDRAFTEARLAEIRRLLDDEQLRDRGVLVEQVSAAPVYEQVSAGYDAEAGGHLLVDGRGADLLNQHAAVPQLLVIQQPPDLGQPGLREGAVVVSGPGVQQRDALQAD